MPAMQPSARVRSAIQIAAFLFILVLLAASAHPALARSPRSFIDVEPSVAFPSFEEFVRMVVNGEEGILRGVYVPAVLALRVVQQPYGNPAYVSSLDGVVTEFRIAAEVGNVGLLAHNGLAGRNFFRLTVGREVYLVFGDGTIETYVVASIRRYQALLPYSVHSDFRDLETGKIITAEELFREAYRGSRHVTFQTCIEAEGNRAWGRLFVIAEPKPFESQIAAQAGASSLP